MVTRCAILAPLAVDEHFDLVIATNILVYYGVFEQSLALANVASKLRAGSVLLSNNVLVELPTTPVHAIGHSSVTFSDRPDDNDIVWYRRKQGFRPASRVRQVHGTRSPAAKGAQVVAGRRQ